MSTQPRLSRSSSRGAQPNTTGTSAKHQQQGPIGPTSVRLPTRSPYVNNLRSTQILSTPLTTSSSTRSNTTTYSMPGTYNDVFQSNGQEAYQDATTDHYSSFPSRQNGSSHSLQHHSHHQIPNNSSNASNGSAQHRANDTHHNSSHSSFTTRSSSRPDGSNTLARAQTSAQNGPDQSTGSFGGDSSFRFSQNGMPTNVPSNSIPMHPPPRGSNGTSGDHGFDGGPGLGGRVQGRFSGTTGLAGGSEQRDLVNSKHFSDHPGSNFDHLGTNPDRFRDDNARSRDQRYYNSSQNSGGDELRRGMEINGAGVEGKGKRSSLTQNPQNSQNLLQNGPNASNAQPRVRNSSQNGSSFSTSDYGHLVSSAEGLELENGFSRDNLGSNLPPNAIPNRQSFSNDNGKQRQGYYVGGDERGEGGGVKRGNSLSNHNVSSSSEQSYKVPDQHLLLSSTNMMNYAGKTSLGALGAGGKGGSNGSQSSFTTTHNNNSKHQGIIHENDDYSDYSDSEEDFDSDDDIPTPHNPFNSSHATRTEKNHPKTQSRGRSDRDTDGYGSSSFNANDADARESQLSQKARKILKNDGQNEAKKSQNDLKKQQNDLSDLKKSQKSLQHLQSDSQLDAPLKKSQISPTLSPLPLIEAPYQRESYAQLTDINTVPRDVYLDYIQHLQRPGQPPHPDNPNQSYSMVDVPKEVEHWTVKLPTRLEFKNVTIRVNKKFPLAPSADPTPISSGPRKAPPGANPQPTLHPDAKRNKVLEKEKRGKLKGQNRAQNGQNGQNWQNNGQNGQNHDEDDIDEGVEFDLDTSCQINPNQFGPSTNNGSYDYSDDDDDDDDGEEDEEEEQGHDGDWSDDGEAFSPSSFKRQQDLKRLNRNARRAQQASKNGAVRPSPSTQSNSVQNGQHGQNGQNYGQNGHNGKKSSVHRNPTSPSHRSSLSNSLSSSIHSTNLGYNIPKPNQLFDDSEDDDAFVSDKKKSFCTSEPFETRPVTILDNLSGCIEPGSMVAIMGGSGAGKTTLLNALSGRVPLVDISTPTGAAHLADKSRPINAGSICFNGTRLDEGELASMTGYVTQNDVFLGTLTPRETLKFAARLQLPDAISEQRRLKRVERIIQQLDLQHIADSPIGGMFSKGISGGQKRRVSVGIELIKDPSVLFLDEPTSGLDSTTAVNVMRVLKHLAQTGRTVIFTIHSPNSKILDLFDTMILLSRGRLAYFGPAKQTLPYFASLGYDCPLFSNPAEFYLNVLTPNSIPMFHTMLHNTHHSPEDMLTPMDPRWKSIVLLRAQQGYHGYNASSPIPHLLDRQNDQKNEKNEKNGQNGQNHSTHKKSPLDWIRQYLGYGDPTVESDDVWSVWINGVKQETLRQRRRRHLIESQHDQYSLLHEYRTINETDQSQLLAYRTATSTNGAAVWDYSLFPQSTHVYQQCLQPPSDTPSSSPPPPNPSYLSAAQYEGLTGPEAPAQLFDVDKILIEREDKRLTLITDTYLRYPVQPNHQLSPFLSNYVPKLRVLDKEGAVALQEIGFDFRQSASSTKNGSKSSKNAVETRERKIDIVQPGKAALPWFDQLKVLTHRTFLHTVRDPLNTVARVGVNILLSIFVGLLFFQTGTAQSSLYARVGFLFFMTSIQAFITVMGAVLTFSEERALFIREYHKQMYATSAYFLGRTFIDIIMQTILAVLFGALAYPLVGLQASFWIFVKYSICLVMVAQGTHSYALVLGALVPYRTVALMLSPVVMVPFLTVSGFMCPINTLSPIIAWLAWLSPQRWMFEAMMNLELAPLAFKCKPHELITVPLDNGTMERICPVLTGVEVLGMFGLSKSPDTFILNIVATLIIAVVVKIIALFCLKFSAWYAVKNSTGA